MPGSPEGNAIDLQGMFEHAVTNPASSWRWGFPAWGMAGAALATMIGSLATALLALGLMLRPCHSVMYQTWSGWRLDLMLMRRLLRFGFSAGLMVAFDYLAFAAFLLLVGRLGYRYYVCRQAQKRGWQTCPAPALPAGPIEDLVVQQIQPLAPAGAAQAFAVVWQALPLAEQARLLQRLVERVDYAAAQQTVSIAFRPDAGTALVEELARSPLETNP
jgi:hypothetical protein